MIKAIIFDMDDTLYREYDFVFGGFKAVANYLAEKNNLAEEEIYKKIIEIFNNEGRGKIFNSICEFYNIDEDINKLIHLYRFHKPNIKLYDDAEEILKWCRDNGIKTGIITDGTSRVQWNKIKALELEKKVDKIIVSDDFGREYWKPHIKTYEEMIKHFNFKAEECIYVGDNPNKDFSGAKNIGYSTLRIIRGEGDFSSVFLSSEYEADKTIGSFLELKIK